MPLDWHYPIYLISHNAGYASIVDPELPQRHLLVIHSDEDAAESFMNEFEIVGEPRALKNDREFAWLLRSLRDPVTEVVFDPRPAERAVNARWQVAVQTLLDHHLDADRSPWNYPVFAVRLPDGYASIAGGENPLTAVAVFSSIEKATAYCDATSDEGTPESFGDMPSVRRFLESLGSNVSAVAFDPVVVDDRRTARHCFMIDTLLTKYLVRDE